MSGRRRRYSTARIAVAATSRPGAGNEGIARSKLARAPKAPVRERTAPTAPDARARRRPCFGAASGGRAGRRTAGVTETSRGMGVARALRRAGGRRRRAASGRRRRRAAAKACGERLQSCGSNCGGFILWLEACSGQTLWDRGGVGQAAVSRSANYPGPGRACNPFAHRLACRTGQA